MRHHHQHARAPEGVAFSHHIFIATAAFLVRKDDSLLVANERLFHRKFTYVLVDSAEEGLAALTRGDEDAAFADDASLWSPMVRLGKTMGDYHFLDKRLSLEPYSIGLRRQDPKFKELVDHVTRRMIQSGELSALYKKWFNSDQGTLPMSIFMREALKRPSDVGVEQIAF